MGVLGKIVGGTLGFVFGGPLGALVGAAAGHHFVDKRSRDANLETPSPASPEHLQAAFSIAFIALAAKLSKVDGRVTRDEIATLRRIFPIPEEAVGEVGAIFNAAKADSAGYEEYARQISDIFFAQPQMLEHIIGALLMIAGADGTYHVSERRFIADVARIFGLDKPALNRIENTFFTAVSRSDETDPYEILGVNRAASDAEIKAAHRKILKENHPDLVMARGLPEEFLEIGNRKLAEANDAYDRIKKERGQAP